VGNLYNLTDPKPLKPALEHEFFSETEEEEVSWLWDLRVVQGKLNILVGHPGVGKSYITVDMAARVSVGKEWPDGNGKAPLGNVLLLSAEDGYADTIKPRLRVHGADLSKVAWIKGKQGSLGRYRTAHALDVDHNLLEAKIKELGVKLVVLDPVMSFTSGKINPNAEIEVRNFLAPLAEIAHRTRAAILGVMHYNKKADLEQIQRTGGAMAWVGVTRSVMGAGETKTPGTYELTTVKINLGPKPPKLSYHLEDVPGERKHLGRLVWDDQLDDPHNAVNTKDVPTQKDQAVEFLRSILAVEGEGPGVDSNDVRAKAKKSEIGDKVLRDASKALRVVKRQQADRSSLWWLLGKSKAEDDGGE